MGDRPKTPGLTMDDVLSVLRKMGVKVMPTTKGHWKVHGPKGIATVAGSNEWHAMENNLSHIRQHAGIDIKRLVADEMLRRNTARLEKKKRKAERAAAREAELEAQAARVRERAERDREQAMGSKKQDSKKEDSTTVAKPGKRRGLHRRFVTWLRDMQPGRITKEDVAGVLGISGQQASSVLAYAAQQGYIARVGMGLYEYTPEPRQPEQPEQSEQPKVEPEVSATNNGHDPSLWEEVKVLADGRLLLQDAEGTLFVATMQKVDV